jgi:hypothetical protein
MMDLIVFGVGFMVSMLVVYGIFSKVPLEMGEARQFREVRVNDERPRRGQPEVTEDAASIWTRT